MNRYLTHYTFILIVLTVTGCAQYSKVRFKVTDFETKQAIEGARLRTFYVKPMMSLTHQRKDKAQTDSGGWATLTVATNQTQWMIGWEYGISARVSVEADGFQRQEMSLTGLSGVPLEVLNQTIEIEMEKTKQVIPAEK